MKYLIHYKIFEKTSLLSIGIPFDVIRSIQKDYEISSDAEWKILKFKKDIFNSLKQKRTLIISVCDDSIRIVYSHNNDYYLETYELIKEDDFGGRVWEKLDRNKDSLNNIIKKLSVKCNNYELISGYWSHKLYVNKKIKRDKKEFDEITNSFKIDFIENFTNIVKKMYGNKARIITNEIIKNLKNIKEGLSDIEIRDILYKNVTKSKNIDILKRKESEKDPFKIKSKKVMDNSLTIFDEYLINFENDYSIKYDEYLNIPIMIEKYGRDKIFTSFMYYVYSGKTINL